MSDLVGNPEDRFSRVAAHFIFDQICNFHYVNVIYSVDILKVVLSSN